MSLLKILKQGGIDWNKPVGLITERHLENGGIESLFSRIGKILPGLPSSLDGSEQGQDFDPEYDLCMRFDEGDDSENIAIIMPDDGATIFGVRGKREVVIASEARLVYHFGQEPEFFARVKTVWALLEGGGQA